MLLQQCNLLPHALLPLCIFEPRYRQLLATALATDRMFCIGNLRSDEEKDEDIHMFTTAGLVRACVTHPDGTSHLMLQGVARIRLTEWVQREPFHTAKLEELKTTNTNPEESKALSRHVLAMALRLLDKSAPGASELANRLRELSDPSVLADFVASHFLTDSTTRQTFLEMDDVPLRLQLLAEKLQ